MTQLACYYDGNCRWESQASLSPIIYVHNYSSITSHTPHDVITGQEGPDGEQRYSSTHSLTSALDWGVWSTLRSGRFTPGKETQAGWAPWPLWTVAGNLDPTGIRSPDRPANSRTD